MIKYLKFIFAVSVVYGIVTLFNNSWDGFGWSLGSKITFTILTVICYIGIITTSDESSKN